jgi:hypothetical protein
MMLILEGPNEVFETGGCGDVAPGIAGSVVAVGPPGLPTAVVPGFVVLFVC